MPVVNITEDFAGMYGEYFIHAYADVVTLYVDKPEEVLLELESAFTHIMGAALNRNPDGNVKKAQDHLYRASLDCFKLMWLKTHDMIEIISLHRDAYKNGEKQLLIDCDDYRTAITKARELELTSIGESDRNKRVLNLWREATKLGKNIYDNTDIPKLTRLVRWSKWFPKGLKLWLYTLLVGVLGGLIVLVIDRLFQRL